MDYFVPNFGRDEDVRHTWNSLDVAEAIKQHRWVYVKDDSKKPDPVTYDYNPDLDDDIEMTNQHMNQSEEKLGKWDYKAIQLDSESQVESQSQSYESLELKELQRQHNKVNPMVYNNPISLAKLTSDPIFSSGELPLPEHKYGTGKRIIVQYPDPDAAGLDEDIGETQQNILSSQKYWKHSWNYNMSASMPNFAIPGKPEYDGENRTHMKTFGQWHIPFFVDGKGDATPVNAQKSNPGSSQAQAQTNHPEPVTKKAAPAPAKAAPTVAPVAKAQVTKPAAALVHAVSRNETNSTANSTLAVVKTISREQMRQQLTGQISQLQKEMQDIWRLQQEKENKLHTLQEELIKNSDVAALADKKPHQAHHHRHHHKKHHHHHDAPAATASAAGNTSNSTGSLSQTHHHHHHGQ